MAGRDRPRTTRSPRTSRRAAMLQAGEALQPTSTATTVRVVDGKTLATDGPFAETKEALGGFYLVEARRPRRGDRARREDPGRAARLDRGPADLGARTGARMADEPTGAPRSTRPADRRSRPTMRRLPTGPDRSCPRRRRPPVPRGAGPGGRDAHPGPRRLRPRRGGRPGGLRHGPRDVAGARRAGQPRGLDHDDRPEPGDRPAAAPARCSPRRRSCSAVKPRSRRSWRRSTPTRPWTERRDEPDRRRPAAADLHVLPSGPADGRRGSR